MLKLTPEGDVEEHDGIRSRWARVVGHCLHRDSQGPGASTGVFGYRLGLTGKDVGSGSAVEPVNVVTYRHLPPANVAIKRPDVDFRVTLRAFDRL
jgi:hypothetical protein